MTYREYLKKERERANSDEQVTRDYFERANIYLDKAGSAGESPSYQWANDNARLYAESINDLDKDTERVGKYIETLRGTEQYDALSKQYNDYRNALSRTRDYLTGLTDFSSQYDNEDDYNSAMTEINRQQKYKDYSYDDLIKASNESENENEAEWLNRKAEEVGSIDDLKKTRDSISAQLDKVNSEIGDFGNKSGTSADVVAGSIHLDRKNNPVYAESEKLEGRKNRLNSLIEERQAQVDADEWETKYKGLNYGELLSEIRDEKSTAENNWLKSKANEVATSAEVESKINALETENAELQKRMEDFSFTDEEQAAAQDKIRDNAAELADLKPLLLSKQKGDKVVEYESVVNNPDFTDKGSYIAPMPETYNLDYMKYRGLVGEGAYLNEQEQAVVNYLYNSGNPEKALEYGELITPRTNQRRTEEFANRAYKLSESMPVLGSAISLGTNLVSGVGAVEDLGNRIIGQPIDVNSPAHTPAHMTNAYRAGVRDQIGDEAGSWLYDTGMSAADSAINMAISTAIGGAIGAAAEGLGAAISAANQAKIVSTISSTIMGSQVATNTVIDAKERGLSDDQAVTLGVLYGVVEGLSEKYSIESFIKNPKSIGSALGKAFIAEGSEEVAANIGDRIVDYLVTGDKNQINQKYQDYIKQGYSDKEALTLVLYNLAAEDTTSFLAGGLSGVAMSGTHMAMSGTVGEIQDHKDKIKLENLNVEELVKPENRKKLQEEVNVAKLLDKDSKGFKAAERIEEAIKAEKDIDVKDVKTIRSEIVKSGNKIRKEDNKRLKSAAKGLTDEERSTVEDLGDKLRRGKSLNNQERNLLNSNPNLLKAISKYSEIDEDGVLELSDIKQFTKNYKYFKSNGNGLIEVDGKEFRGTIEIERTDPDTGEMELNLIAPDDTITTVNTRDTELDFKSDEESKLFAAASTLKNADEANALVENYEGGDVESYLNEWNLFSNYGKLGYTQNQIAERIGSGANNAARNAAYGYGLENFKAHAQAQYLSAKSLEISASKFSYQKGNFVYNVSAEKKSKLTTDQKAAVSYLRALSYTGLNVEVFESKQGKDGRFVGEQGSYDRATKTLRVDVNAGFQTTTQAISNAVRHGMFLTAGHELTHTAEQGKSYLRMRHEIVRTLDKAGFDYSELVAKKVRELANMDKYKDLSKEELYRLADSEAIADCCETMLQNSKLFENLVNENGNFAQKLIDAIKKAIADLRAYFKDNDFQAKTEYGQALFEAMDKVENRVQELWDKAVAEGIKAEKAESEVKYSRRYAKQGGEWSDALTGAEWTKFNHAISTGIDAGLRISDNAILVECENDNIYQYKLLVYDSTFENNPIKSIYAISNIDYNIDDARMIAGELDDLEASGYEQKYAKKILKTIAAVHKIVLGKYNSKNASFSRIGNNAPKNGANTQQQSNRTATITPAGQIKYSDRVTQIDTDYLSAVERGDMQTAQKMVDEDNKDIRYQDRTYDELESDRVLLAQAMENLAQNDFERDAIKRYQDYVSKIDKAADELIEVNKKIKDISFTKGSDRSQLRKLNEQKKKLENKISWWDRKLINTFEKAKPLKDLFARARKESVKRQKAKSDLKYNRYRENIRKRNLYDRIAWNVKRLNRFLDNADPNKRVKEGLRDINKKILKTSQYLLYDNLSTRDIVRNGVESATPEEQKLLKEYYGIIGNVDHKLTEAEKETLKRLRSQLKDLINREKAAFEKGKEELFASEFSKSLVELQEAYKLIKESDLAYIRDAYDDAIVERIEEFKQEVSKTLSKDLTSAQLEDFRKIVAMISHTISKSNKLHLSSKSYTETAQTVMSEIEGNRQQKEIRRTLPQLFGKAVLWNNFKPVYAIRYIGSKELERIYWKIQQGELDWMNDIEEARDFLWKMKDKYDYKHFDMKLKKTFTAANGTEFELTKNQMFAVYVLSRREQALQHLLKGGFTFPKGEKAKGGKHTGSTSYPLNAQIITDITNELSDNEKHYAEALQKYLSEVMAKKGNEVSMELYGVELFNEDSYWSIQSSADHRKVETIEQKGEFMRKNAGFTKATVRNASNPIVLNGFEEAWADHVNEMSLYHATTLPIEDFSKVLNYNARAEENKTVKNVRTVLTGSFGQASTDYFNTFLKDINGGFQVDSREKLFDTFVSGAKKAAVMLNLSVVLQQPMAAVRAMNYISPKFFLPMKLSSHSQKWEQLKKYAKVASIKEMGIFDVGMGQGAVDWINTDERAALLGNGISGFVKAVGNNAKDIAVDSAYRDEVLSRGASYADEVAWLKIWNAVQHETKAKYGYALNSEKNLIKSGERFNEVIHLTQVYDSVLTRSHVMRSKSTFLKMATSFMAEPTTIVNMAVDASVQLARTGNARPLLRAGAVLIVSMLLNDLMKSITGAMRDDDDKDDKGNVFIKYKNALISNLTSDVNPASYFPICRDIVSLAYGYHVDRMDMTLASNVINSARKFFEEPTEINIVNLVGRIFDCFGIPLYNFVRDANSVINTYNKFRSQNQTVFQKLGLEVEAEYQSKYDKYWVEGEEEEKCKSKAKSDVKTKITNTLKPLYLEALKKQDSNTIYDIRRFMRDSDYYDSLNDVDKALENWRKAGEEQVEKEKRAEERKK